MKIKNLISERYLYFRVFFLVLSFWPIFLKAQVSCGGQDVTNCLLSPQQTYQCIEGNSASIDLYGTKLLAPGLALSIPQFLIVRGKITFTENYTFAPGSEVIFLDNSSGFTVNQFVRLTLVSSSFHGCSKLWAGIEMLANSIITAQNCTFEDAFAAIKLRNQTKIEITGNIFRKNVCGILGLREVIQITTPISILLGSRNGISGNAFWGNDQLLEPAIPRFIDSGINSDATSATTNYPYAGIWIERVNSFSIGMQSDLPGASLNSFLNFGQVDELNVQTEGIRAIESNIDVCNSVFSNFGKFDNLTSDEIKSVAINADNEGSVLLSTIITGVNNTSSVGLINTFSNCYRDIKATGTNLTVRNMTSNKSYNSIECQTHSVSGLPIYEIKDNTIDYFKNYAINIEYRKPIRVDIQNNKIYDNDAIGGPVKPVAIRINTPMSNEFNFNGSMIKNNDIRSRSILTGGTFYGIILARTSYLTIEQNLITDMQPETNLGAFYGIRTEKTPCNGLRIYSNSFTGSSINYTDVLLTGLPTRSSGIYLEESVDCIINCNSTDNNNNGMIFLGICDNTKLTKNKFYLHTKGLSVGTNVGVVDPEFGMIGPQIKAENRWFGTDSPIEAFAINTAAALASPFQINSSDFNLEYWPYPRKIGPMDDNFIWFTQVQGEEPSNDFTCNSGKTYGESTLADSDSRLINGTFQPWLDYPALEWEAKWHFAARLNRNTNLQNIDQSTQQYYIEHYNENYSQLNRAYQAFINRWAPDEVFKNHLNTFNSLINQRFELNQSLPESYDANNNLYEQMLQIEAYIVNKGEEIKNYVEIWENQIDQQVDQLINQINATICTEEYETNMKTVLNIMFQTHFSDGQLNDEQSGIISQIGNKCRYAGGYAVVLARAFFEPLDTYPQDNQCVSESRSYSGNDISDDIIIFPNPAKQSTTISINSPSEMATLQVFSAEGCLIKRMDRINKTTEINISEWPVGTYFFQLTSQGKKSVYRKFIKI